MSHVTCSKVIIEDIDALEAACKRMGLTFVRDKKNYKWWGEWLNDWGNNERQANLRGIDPDQFGKCDHLIRVPDADEGYEIGVTRRKDGAGWQVVWDDVHNNAINKAIGAEGQKLTALYAEEVCRKHAEEIGAQMECIELEDGNLRIELITV